MKYPQVLERHRYAPELNKLHWRGATFPAPGCQTLREARQHCFKRPQTGRFAILKALYPEPYQSHNRTYSGLYSSPQELRDFLAGRRRFHCHAQVKIVKLGLIG